MCGGGEHQKVAVGMVAQYGWLEKSYKKKEERRSRGMNGEREKARER
jgi:hypothetical protein